MEPPSNEKSLSADRFTALTLPNFPELGLTFHAVEENNKFTRPLSAFLGWRRSQVCPLRSLEEGRYNTSQNSSSSSLTLAEDDKPLPPLPCMDGLRDIGTPIPPKRGNQFSRFLRWNFGTVYRRIFCLAFLGNIAAIAVLFAKSFVGSANSTNGTRFTYQEAAAAVATNIFVAMLVRNEHIVNAMFIVFGTWSARLPFQIRRLFAKVYSYGGIHSGCSVASVFWFATFLVLLTLDYAGSDITIIRSYVLFVSYAILLCLVSIIIFAHPHLRSTLHNWFEGIHRFLGWTAVLLFWAQEFLLVADTAESHHVMYGTALVASPTFWLLVLISLLVIYPWARIRRRAVEAEPLSHHAIKLNFKYADVQFGQAVRLSDAPLKETHAFAVIPNSAGPETTARRSGIPVTPISPSNSEVTLVGSEEDELSVSVTGKSKAIVTEPAVTNTSALSHAGEKGFSVIISNAGDWTNKIIRNPPTRIYIRGVPQFGVLRVAALFSPVVIMATGSGIGPCLSLFVQKPDHPVRIVWSAPSPLETFGRAVLDVIYRADPDAVVIDTRKAGRPDLVRLGFCAWQGRPVDLGVAEVQGKARGPVEKNRTAVGKCEAVVFISNQKLTRKVVYGLESRGVPAYGAIFDS